MQSCTVVLGFAMHTKMQSAQALWYDFELNMQANSI